LQPEVLVLLSGGIDSSACIHFYLELGRPPFALFVDYGQLPARRELAAASEISRRYSVPLKTVVFKGTNSKTTGYIAARNAFLLTVALMEKPASASVIALGIHAGSGYCDCSPGFISRMQSVYDLYEQGRVQIAAPFIEFTKGEIITYCLDRKVPLELTYSCESSSDSPCGVCLSCKDRELL
jgi:7-cyano-7-deazaguanine synthase